MAKRWFIYSPHCILNPGIVTIKMLCDGLGITLVEFFDTPEFKTLEQEIN